MWIAINKNKGKAHCVHTEQNKPLQCTHEIHVISSIKKQVGLHFRLDFSEDSYTSNYREKCACVMGHQRCGSHGCTCFELGISSLSLCSDNTTWFNFLHHHANGAHPFIFCPVPPGSKDGREDPLSEHTKCTLFHGWSTKLIYPWVCACIKGASDWEGCLVSNANLLSLLYAIFHRSMKLCF